VVQEEHPAIGAASLTQGRASELSSSLEGDQRRSSAGALERADASTHPQSVQGRAKDPGTRSFCAGPWNGTPGLLTVSPSPRCSPDCARIVPEPSVTIRHYRSESVTEPGRVVMGSPSIRTYSDGSGPLVSDGSGPSGDLESRWGRQSALAAPHGPRETQQRPMKSETFGKVIPTVEYSAQWGRPGTGNGRFQDPVGIATDATGNIYVAGEHNNRVEKFRGYSRRGALVASPVKPREGGACKTALPGPTCR
jgi:hypothetical protein